VKLSGKAKESLSDKTTISGRVGVKAGSGNFKPFGPATICETGVQCPIPQGGAFSYTITKTIPPKSAFPFFINSLRADVRVDDGSKEVACFELKNIKIDKSN
jgi:hypothetical protein